MQPSRFQLALALAAATHAGAWLLRPSTAARPAPPTEAPASEVIVEVERGPGSAQPSSASTSSERTEHAVAAAGSSTTRSASSTGDGPPARGDATAEVGAAPASSAPVVSVWNMDALAQRDLGVGETRSFAKPPPPLSDAEVAQQRIQRSLEDGLRDSELASGDTVSGPIVHALEDGAQAGLAPVNGHATFEARIDAKGVLLSLSAVDSSSNRKEWDDIAKSSALGLAKRQLRTSKRGLVVRVEVTSREQLPSGASRGVGGDVLSDGSGQPHAVGVHVLPTAPSTRDGLGRKAEFTPLGGSFDLADVGAHAQRVIAAHATSVRDL